MIEAQVPTAADAAKAAPVNEGGKKKSYHHGDLRNAIILEATARARESGEKAIVLREIAPRIGVSATAAYRHFANRQQLVEEVSGRGFAAMRDRIAAIEPTTATTDPVLAAYIDLRNAAIAVVGFAVDEPAWARMMLETLGVSSVVAESGMSVREVMQDIVDRGIDEGAFMPGLRLDGQRAMWAAIDGLSAQAMFGVHPMDTESADQAIARTLDLCLTDLLTERAIQARAAVDLPAGIITDARV